MDRKNVIFDKRVKGVNFGFLNKRGYYETDFAKAQPALMRSLGVNCVTLNLNVCQEKYCSTKVFLDFKYSAGESELLEMAKLLHENDIMVILKPNITCLDGQPMCNVSYPEIGRQIEGVEVDYRSLWFESYAECLLCCARLAEKMNAEAMLLGAELLGVEGERWGNDMDKYWLDIIERVRKVYGGALSYEFTFLSRKQYELRWFSELDFLSYSYYPPACPPDHLDDPQNNPSFTRAELYEYLLPRAQRIQSIIDRFDKPILFAEYGVRSAHGCIQRPFDFLWRTRYDGDEQANYLLASVDVFKPLDRWMGFLWWKWDETQNRPHYVGENGEDKGFTFVGKPAEKAFKELEL